ncbi:MAG: guanine permease [Gammaproteobacteria bacterium]|jgi:AGZA family xanthine/uracil permease-like MFS transporter|nr:guanine permease [Gammaproteobacteria bacterium]
MTLKNLLLRVDRFFELTQHTTTVRIELLAGMTTFLTMAYILFANPAILGSAGMNSQSVFVATCLVSAIGSLLIGLSSNYPIAIAPGMALNVYFSYTIVQSLGYSWQSALGAVFISGILFLVMSLTHIRRLILQSLPENLCIAVTTGLGLFIGLIALKSAGIIIANPNTMVTLGHVGSLQGLLFLFGFCLITVLEHYRIPGSIIFSILATTCLSILFKLSVFHGILSLPPIHNLALFAFDIKNLWTHQGIAIILTFLLVALFDSTGTLVGLLQFSGLSKDAKKTERLSHALAAESIATITGSLLGTSSTSPYIESSAGIKMGGRTGLTAVTVAILFLCSLFFSPLAQTIPTYATSAALLFIACLMIRNLTHIDWNNLTESIPSLLTALMIPLTFSIADGFGIGIISYVILKFCCKKICDLNPILILLALIFIGYFIYRAHS